VSDMQELDPTPISDAEKLAILKRDALPLLRGDNRDLSDAVCKEILILMRGIDEINSRQH
jgi:hypothetical protein